MPEHYTKSTLEATSFCQTCGRRTQHAVSCGRIGRCLEHEPSQYSKKQLADRARRAKRDKQMPLFDR